MSPLYDVHPLLKAIQLIALVSYFSGAMHIVRLFVAHRTSFSKWEPDRKILSDEFNKLEKRALFFWIWPSLILVLLIGAWMAYKDPGLLKLPFVQVGAGLMALLIGYQFSLHGVYGSLRKGTLKWSAFQLYMWSFGPTIFLYALILLALMRDRLTWIWGIGGLVVLGGIVMYVISSFRKTLEPDTHVDNREPSSGDRPLGPTR